MELELFIIIVLLLILGGLIGLSERIKAIEVHLRIIKDILMHKK